MYKYQIVSYTGNTLSSIGKPVASPGDSDCNLKTFIFILNVKLFYISSLLIYYLTN